MLRPISNSRVPRGMRLEGRSHASPAQPVLHSQRPFAMPSAFQHSPCPEQMLPMRTPVSLYPTGQEISSASSSQACPPKPVRHLQKPVPVHMPRSSPPQTAGQPGQLGRGVLQSSPLCSLSQKHLLRTHCPNPEQPLGHCAGTSQAVPRQYSSHKHMLPLTHQPCCEQSDGHLSLASTSQPGPENPVKHVHSPEAAEQLP
mmetsp:Transcript_25741/g.65445  ORF Transcript_25741/g.65445 Transcript_25741/m.65445 type:complete len:200 (+) Transcript_25741:558-1157(+)